MKVGQLKPLMPRPLSLLLFLLICHVASPALSPTHLAPLPSLYIPVGVGFTPDITKLTDFGIFGEYNGAGVGAFNTCGKKTVQKLNPEIDSSVEVENICEPTPDRVIVQVKGTPHDFGKFERKLTEECELFTCSSEDYPAAGTQSGLMNIKAYFAPTDPNSQEKPEVRDVADVPVNNAVPEKAETNVCKDKKAGYSEGATGSVLFANEDKCYTTHGTLRDQLEAADSFIQVPRWLAPGQQVKNIQPFYFNAQRLSFSSHRTNYGFKAETGKNGLEYKKCHTACDSGKVLKIAMKKTKYKMSITINPATCTAFRICLAPHGFTEDSVIPTCDPDNIIDVNVKSGIVIWPNKGRASLIQLKSSHRAVARPVVIEFGYGIETNGKEQAEYYIGNDHREIVASNSDGFKEEHSQQIVFFFQQEDSLQKSAGIFSKHIEYAKSLTSADVKLGNLYDENLNPIQAPQLHVPSTTTTIAPVDFPRTTTAAPAVAHPDAAKLVDADEAHETNAQSKATYVTGKWWTWGVFIGFVIGTLITLGIGAGLFYVLRRTIFGIWYRGMYKRYGCDVSGTTGGITGVGFGNTVTGDVTVQGTTGGGTTIGGATSTGSSTMGTTSSGTSGGGTTGGATATETSTLLDKTGGGGESKSIAM